MSTTSPPGQPPRSDPDVLVIGGGIVGLFCAYHLRRAGSSVAVVERAAVGGPDSCSSGNTGFVGTHGAAPLAAPGVPGEALRSMLRPAGAIWIKPRWDGELFSWLRHFRHACNDEDASAGYRVLLDLKKRSLDVLQQMCGSGRLAGTFSARGMLVAYRTPRGFERARRSVPRAVADGLPLRALDPAELRTLEPDVDFDVCGALYNEEGAYLRVPEFVRELAATLQGMGVQLHSHTEVVGFQVNDRTVSVVRTTRGEFRPREVVLAAGAWSAQCARDLDLGLKLQPAKGYTVTVRMPPNAPRLPVLLAEGRVAVAPLGDRLRFAGAMELSGLDSSIVRGRVNGILRTVHAYLPRLEQTATVEVWAGLRPCTPDSLPLLGRAAPYRNLSVACGHGHIGMGLAPAGGKLLAQVVLGERPDMDLAPMRVDRYRRQRRARG
jgi:D-amino-acid dehydrogenase